MKDRKNYQPITAEIVHLDEIDVITTSGLDPELPEAEWDKEM